MIEGMRMNTILNFCIAIVWLMKAMLMMVVTAMFYLPKKLIDIMKQK